MYSKIENNLNSFPCYSKEVTFLRNCFTGIKINYFTLFTKKSKQIN